MKHRLNANAQAVLDTVRAMDTHPTALEIYESVRRVRPQIGIASVYRILHNLVGQGYVLELGRSQESCRYDGHTERHDHAVCTNCGALLDVPLEIPLSHEVLEQAARAAGIELTSHEVRLYGRCPSCHR